jgi:small subunit ribosomal protein S11
MFTVAPVINMMSFNRLFSTVSTAAPFASSNIIKILFNCLPNNIHIAVSSPPGRLLFKLSSGSVGLAGSAKTAPKAVPLVLDALKAKLPEEAASGEKGLRVEFRGISSSRGQVVSGLRRLGLRILEVSDSTGIPFNGCRPKRSRRL